MCSTMFWKNLALPASLCSNSGAYGLLELYEAKVSRTVLRGGGSREATSLPA